MKQVVLLLGGNMGNRLDFIHRAQRKIEQRAGKIIQSSAVYESAPWGFAAENSFYNQVVIVETPLGPFDILENILTIEKELGRVRSGKNYSSRTMDIDILFYDQEMIDTTELVIPHPQLHKRRFTLIPLVEILPGWIHPGFNQSLTTLLENCEDKSSVTLIS